MLTHNQTHIQALRHKHTDTHMQKHTYTHTHAHTCEHHTYIKYMYLHTYCTHYFFLGLCLSLHLSSLSSSHSPSSFSSLFFLYPFIPSSSLSSTSLSTSCWT